MLSSAAWQQLFQSSLFGYLLLLKHSTLWSVVPLAIFLEILSSCKPFSKLIFPPVTDSNEDVAARMKEAKKPNATLIAFEKLRDTAVENLCKALRAGMRTHEKDIVKALIFSVSNRLYTQQDKAKDAQLMSQNTILTLGHIAVALRHEEKVAYFKWSFC